MCGYKCVLMVCVRGYEYVLMVCECGLMVCVCVYTYKCVLMVCVCFRGSAGGHSVHAAGR